MLLSQEAIIIALSKGSGTCIIINEDSEVPRGCGSEVVTSDITVHIPVQVSRASTTLVS
jgi:valyl-tRNA synthetase